MPFAKKFSREFPQPEAGQEGNSIFVKHLKGYPKYEDLFGQTT